MKRCKPLKCKWTTSRGLGEPVSSSASLPCFASDKTELGHFSEWTLPNSNRGADGQRAWRCDRVGEACNVGACCILLGVGGVDGSAAGRQGDEENAVVDSSSDG